MKNSRFWMDPKALLTAALVVSMSILVSAVPQAANHGGDHGGGEPTGGCPDQFVLHRAGHCDCDHSNGSHIHAGIDTDRNGDGWICMKHVGVDEGVHVHIDNNKKLR